LVLVAVKALKMQIISSRYSVIASMQ